MSPFYAAQLLTSAKSFLDNPLIGSARLNRLGLHRMRVRLADAMCRWRRGRLARHVRPEWREAFERDGFVIVEDVVPVDQWPALRSAILAYEGPAREMQQGDAITRRMAIDPDMLAAIPALRALLASKDITALFHYVAGFRTTPLHYIQTIVSHCGGNEPDPQESLHADSFHASMKAWLFLNPVSADQGPFTYVRGSHRFDTARLEWEHARSLRDPDAIDRLSARGSPRVDDADLAAMGLNPPEALALPANTLVVADTGGFHARGRANEPGERVEIWSYSRRNPFLPWLGGDLLSLPGVAERRVGWIWKIQDLVGRPWNQVGIRTALTRPAADTD
jgi:Phytanoyl-CoA dioxygenase (PhyH).